MGVKSTSTISRRKAYELLINAIPRLSNEAIGNVLDVAWDELGHRYDNFVVRDGDCDDDDRFSVDNE